MGYNSNTVQQVLLFMLPYWFWMLLCQIEVFIQLRNDIINIISELFWKQVSYLPLYDTVVTLSLVRVIIFLMTLYNFIFLFIIVFCFIVGIS